MSEGFAQGLWRILDDDQRAIGRPTSGWNPLDWSRTEQINFAVTYGLTAIGLCLMLGFCTRLAALGGAAFMAFVVATQPSWPTIYPPAPAVVGHALLVNKDFIEMVALLDAGHDGRRALGRARLLHSPLVHRAVVSPRDRRRPQRASNREN